MVQPEGVTPEEAAMVFRRAAELQAASVNSDAIAPLDADTLEQIGGEAGLSPASVRAALADYRGGVLDASQSAGDIVASRVVPGPQVDANLAVEEFARRNLLSVRRHEGSVTVWARKPGLNTALLRRFGGKSHYPLVALKELRATVTDYAAGSRLVRVRLEGQLTFPWRTLSLPIKTVVAAGVGGGITGVVLAAPELASGNAVIATGASLLTALGASGLGVRHYRAAVGRAEAVLDLFLDRLEWGSRLIWQE
jgi:hypothetical protein